MLIWMNGAYIDEKKAAIPITSEAFLFGYAVFETLRTYHKNYFRLEDHLERLYASADYTGFRPKWPVSQVQAQALEMLKHCSWPHETKLRIILTRDDLMMMAEPLEEKPTEWYEKGVKAVSFPGERTLPLAKNLADVLCYAAKHHATEKGVYESILVNSHGHVREGAYSNLFWVKGEQLFTVGQGVLEGITRQTVMELSGNCQFGEISYSDLLQVDELFITQTSSGILPVVEVDGVRIGSGLPGEVTRGLMEKLDELKG